MRRIIPALLGIWLLAVAMLDAQPRGRVRPQFIDPEQLDPGQGEQVLHAFRNARLAGDYAFRFELTHYPRGGEAISYAGSMFGTWMDDGRALTRVRLNTPQGPLRLLQRGGAQGAVYEQRGGDAPRELAGEALFRPLVGEMTYTPFEIQMPFLFWTDYVYEGTRKVRGRPAHFFLLYPPADFQLADIGAVRVVIDADFNALLDAEILDPDGNVIKSFHINSFKKVDGQWIVKEIDLVDERTRDKTRFEVTAAHVGMELPASVFDVGNLSKDLQPVPPEDYKRL